MIHTNVKVRLDTQRVTRPAQRASYRNLRHAAFSIRKSAARSIRLGRGRPSDPGDPPRSRGVPGHSLRGALWVDVNEYSAVIGPRHSWVGKAGAAHEFGGDFRGTRFPQRPFMGPALQDNLDRFHRTWRGSVAS